MTTAAKLKLCKLLQAVEDGNATLVRSLLENGADANERHPLMGDPALNRAMMNDCSPEVAKLLLQHGAEVNAVNREGNSAVMYAGNSNRVKLVELLIEHGADLRIINKISQNAFGWASGESKMIIRNALLADRPEARAARAAEAAQKAKEEMQQKIISVHATASANQDLIRSNRPPVTVKARPVI